MNEKRESQVGESLEGSEGSHLDIERKQDVYTRHKWRANTINVIFVVLAFAACAVVLIRIFHLAISPDYHWLEATQIDKIDGLIIGALLALSATTRLSKLIEEH